MDTGKLVMFGALGYGAYLLYQKYASAAVPVGPAVALLAAPAAVAPAAASQMDSWYSQLKAAAASDPNFTGSGDALLSSPDHWNVYLNSVTGYSANLDSLFGTINPATQTRASNVTAAAFWSAVAPGLKSAKGLAGLGMYGGLGRICYGREWN